MKSLSSIYRKFIFIYLSVFFNLWEVWKWTLESFLLKKCVINNIIIKFQLGGFYYNKLQEDKEYQTLLEQAEEYDEKKWLEYALELYNKALELNSEDAKLYYQIGLVYAQKQDNNKAIECFKKRVEITPSPDVYFMMSYDYKALNQYTEALECMKIAVSKDPKNATYYYAIAKIYGEMGDKENEKSSYGKSALYGDEDVQEWLNSHK